MIQLIYEEIDTSKHKEIKQGDIFKGLPKMTYQHDAENFNEYVRQIQKQLEGSIGKMCVSLKPTNAVLLTQTCDAIPDSNLDFSALDKIKFSNEFPEKLDSNTKKGVHIKHVKKVVRDQTRYHFFPQNKLFRDHSYKCDFRELFFVPYNHVIKHLELYLHARLITEAVTVLQDKIANFFTRLAFEDTMFFPDDVVKHLLNKKGISERKKIIYSKP